jgi:prolyl oligopeptidase
MHARKMAARLQAASPDTATLLRVEPRAGHGQGKPAAKIVPEETDVWAFLFAQLG